MGELGTTTILTPLMSLFAALAPSEPVALAEWVSPGKVARIVVAPQRETDSIDELWQQGRRLEAIAKLEAFLAESGQDDPGGAQAIRLAGWQIQVHRYSAALDTLGGLDAQLDGLRGEALYALTRYDEALELLDPEDSRHALLRVDALEALGRLEEAGAELDRAIEVVGAQEPRLASFQGRRLAREGRHEEAEERFRVALTIDPVDQRARFGLGRSLLALGRRAEGVAVLEEHRRLVPLVDALEFAEQSLDVAPHHGPNHAGLAEAEAAIGLADRARASFRRASELAAPEEVVPIALRHGRFLEEQCDDSPGALAALAAAFQSRRDVRIAVRAGDVAARAGLGEDAVQWYRTGLELRPGDPAIERRLENLEESGR